MFILKNVTAVQLEPTLVLEGVDIAIEGSLIKAVGPNLRALYPEATYREMGGKLVMPGIVCATTTSTPACRGGSWPTSPLARILSPP